MRRQNIELKKVILDRMDEKDYNAMVKIMADDIYNKVEYDIIILMARKCSNLYNAMLPLVKEERDGLIGEVHRQLVEKHGGREPIILTDRALDWVIWSIRQDAADKHIGIRKILLADDIIIHGRTLLRTKGKLEEAFHEAGIEDYTIDIVTFAANTDELLMEDKEICNLSDIHQCTISDWKPFSGQIVDTIYLLGQTYTSYVPRLRINMDSEFGNMIRQFIDRGDLLQITDPEREGLGVKTYACVVEGQEQYKLCESYRVYEFSNRKEYVFVPMVSLQAVDEECLNRYIESLLTLGIIVQSKVQERDMLKEFLNNCSGEYKYRLVLYAASAFAGWRFLRDSIGVKDEQIYDCYDREAEMLNFYFLELKSYSQLRENQISLSDLSKKLEEDYSAMSPLEEKGNIAEAIQDAAVKSLADSLTNIIEESKLKDTDIDMVGKLLTVNNTIDEERYRDSVKKEEKDIHDRVMGIPLIDIVNMLVKKGRLPLATAFASVLKAVDYGRGSIVAHCFTLSTGRRWYTSLVHAGEENYRYYITYYLPVLYGLSMLEFRSNNTPDIATKKNYWEKFYAENSGLKYLNADREHLVQTRTLQELKDVVEYAALYQQMRQTDKEALSSAIKMTKEYIR